MRTAAPSIPPIQDQQRFWNWHWQHAAERGVVNEWSERRFQAISAYLHSLPLGRPSILDLGCGRGWYTARLAEFGPTTGIDLSPEAASLAQVEFPHVAFRAGNILEMDLPAAEFDIVVSQEVISHVEDQARYVERAAHVLKPGGFLILSTDNKYVLERLDTTGWVPLPPEHIKAFLDRKGLKRLLQPHFDVLRTTTVIPVGDRGLLRIVNSYRLNRILERLIPPDRLAALKERAGLGLTFVWLARKRAAMTPAPARA